MVETQIRARDVTDEAVLAAMLAIPRERFLPRALQDRAYEDCALGIGESQTISQPYIVAYMTALLSLGRGNCRVLEIGTGTGYQTAILARLAKQVYTVERIRSLYEGAGEALSGLGLTNVTRTCGDGSVGWQEHAPYDRIIVTAVAPSVSSTLTRQLVDGGILVTPIGGAKSKRKGSSRRSDSAERIVRVERIGARTVETPLLRCRFVKLLGAEGWETDKNQ